MRNDNIKLATLRLHLGSEHKAILALWFLSLLSCACPWEYSWKAWSVGSFFLAADVDFQTLVPEPYFPFLQLCGADRWQRISGKINLCQRQMCSETRRHFWVHDVVTQGWIKRSQVLCLCIKSCLCWMVMENWSREFWCEVALCWDA